MSANTSFESFDSPGYFIDDHNYDYENDRADNTQMSAATISSSVQRSKQQRHHNIKTQHTQSTQPLSITPVSTSSRSSLSSPRGSMAKSNPSSPREAGGIENVEMDSLPPLALPKSMMAPMTPPTTTADMNSSSAKGQGLMHRLSRSASNRLRGRPSASSIRSRDQSFGSVRRRRSDSKSVTTDGVYDISDLELDSDEDLVYSEATSPINPDANNSAPGRQFALPSRPSRRHSIKVPSLLSECTVFTKMTKKKQKILKLCLDRQSAKISWSTKQIYVDDIKDIRTGDSIQSYLEELQLPADFSDRWFTIVHTDPDRLKGRSIKAMHLMADDRETRDRWVTSLRYLIKTRDTRMTRMTESRESPLLNHWRREMAKKGFSMDEGEEEETMDYAAIKRTCRSFSINKSDQILRAHFESVNTDNFGRLKLPRYLEFFRQLMERKDIRNIYERAKSPEDTLLTLDNFLQFLQKCQGEDVGADPDHWCRVFSDFANKRRGPSTQTVPPTATRMEQDENEMAGMTFEAFRDFLLSDVNAVIAQSQPNSLVLDRPLNEYFISSSHNTYLRGRQVGGESSPEAYTEALQRGCRCIEIDCWDGEDGKPRVTHGRTLTSSTSFLECIKSINRSAFAASEYPLIISLEVHCSPDQQKVMAEVMKEHFGDQLLLQPLKHQPNVLPAPEMLKRKILIKVKEPRIDPTSTSVTPVSNVSAVTSIVALPMSTAHRRQRSVSAPNPPLTRAGSTLGNLASMQAQSRNPYSGTTLEAFQHPRVSSPLFMQPPSVSNTSSDESDIEMELGRRRRNRKIKQSNIVEVLGNMAVYTRGIKFSGWRVPQTKTYNHIFSFNENTFLTRCKSLESKVSLERHNVGHLMRVYPKGSRVNSSNFDPIQFWRRGVQMAATNWQTYDLGTQINNAMFAAGADQTGYVLKPNELRQAKESGQSAKLHSKEVKFSVEIISAQWLALPSNTKTESNVNPYVEFEMYSAEDKGLGVASGEGGTDASDRSGVSGIGSPLRKRTCIVEGNGFDPVFNAEITMTLNTKYPSLVFVRWAVWNSLDGRTTNNAKPIATFTAKLSSLKQGYRRLRLVNNVGEELHSSLFCKIKKQDHRDVEVTHPANDRRPSQPFKRSMDQPRNSEDSTTPTLESTNPKKFSLRRLLSRGGSNKRTGGVDFTAPQPASDGRKTSYEKS